MEHCRSPDGITSISVRPYYTMLSRVYLALAMGFLVFTCDSIYAIARIWDGNSVCLSVCHTGGSVKNG